MKIAIRVTKGTKIPTKASVDIEDKSFLIFFIEFIFNAKDIPIQKVTIEQIIATHIKISWVLEKFLKSVLEIYI